MSTPLIWSTNSRLDQIMARAASSLNALRQMNTNAPLKMGYDDFCDADKLRAQGVTVELNRSQAFFDTFSAPVSAVSDLKKLLENERSRVSPLFNDDTLMLPVRAKENEGFSLLHIRSETLHALEQKSGKLGLNKLYLSCEDVPDVLFETPFFMRQARLSRQLAAVAACLVLAGTWLGLSTYGERQETIALTAEAQEQSLRAEVMARNEVSVEVAAFERLAANRPRETSPEGVLSRIAVLTEATPQTTWWAELSLSAETILISAISNDAGASLQDISSAFPNRDVQFAGAVSDISGERQAFTIEITAGDDDEQQ